MEEVIKTTETSSVEPLFSETKPPRKKRKIQTSQVVLWIILGVLCLMWLIPLLYMLFASFTSDKVLVQGTDDGRYFNFFPPEWSFESYLNILSGAKIGGKEAPVMLWFGNSLFVSAVNTFLVVLISAMAAYGYSRMRFKGRDFAFGLLLVTMMFPGVINLIPNYLTISTLGLKNNYLALIIPGLGGVGNIFLIRQFFYGVPKDFDEAAKIDGAGDFRIFFQILLPQLVPVLVVVGLFTFLGSWNDLLWPQIVMQETKMLTLTAGLGQIGYERSLNPSTSLAAAVISMIPVLILYIFAQKFLLQGISISSGVKD